MDLRTETLNNKNYRKVIYTVPKSFQLVLMSLKPSEEIGMESHKGKTQFISVESGAGMAIIDGVHHAIGPGWSVVIPPGSMHNIINLGTTRLQLYTVYTPPEHKVGTVQRIKKISKRR